MGVTLDADEQITTAAAVKMANKAETSDEPGMSRFLPPHLYTMIQLIYNHRVYVYTYNIFIFELGGIVGFDLYYGQATC